MPRRILFLASGLDAVSCRFRIFQYLPYLRQMGMQVDVGDLHVSAWHRWGLLRSTAAYDTVVIHRAFLTPLEHQVLRRCSRGYVFDFDDAIMFRDSSRRGLASRQRSWRFKRMVRGARRVIAGNAYLAGWAARYNKRVEIFPTTIDLADYPGADAAGGEPVVGWIGTSVNLMYLERIAPALRRLRERRSDVKLKIVCDEFLDVPGIEVVKKPWSLADEVADLRSFRVGVMPLADDAWTRGKCALKILQYFAAGRPVVCAPVGANLEVVEHGQNGYFACNDDEWVAYLDELLGDPDKCRQFGRAGRRTVEQRYSVQARVSELAGLLE